METHSRSKNVATIFALSTFALTLGNFVQETVSPTNVEAGPEDWFAGCGAGYNCAIIESGLPIEVWYACVGEGNSAYNEGAGYGYACYYGDPIACSDCFPS